MNSQPLVSICVIAYSSSKFVLETLESAKAQTYKNIELIVSDDCSPDDTVQVCEKWISENKDRFVSCKVVTTPKNTGVTANCNRAIEAAKGEWIKIIAGDDMLLPECISTYIDYTQKNPDAKVCIANIKKMLENFNRKIVNNELPDTAIKFNGCTAKEQYMMLLCGFLPDAPTLFISAEVCKKIKFDEQYPFMEDFPMWLRLTRAGIRMHVIDNPTVIYRSGESLVTSSTRFISPNFRDSVHKFFWNEYINYIKEEHLNEVYDRNRKTMFLRDIAELFFHNRRTRLNFRIYRIIEIIIRKYTHFNL